MTRLLALVLLVAACSKDAPITVPDLGTAPLFDLSAPPSDIALELQPDLLERADLLELPDLTAVDLVQPTCGEKLQHCCDKQCAGSLVCMPRGNDPEDVHCFDPAECGAEQGAPCCSIAGGTIAKPWGYCAGQLTCQGTCQP